LKKQFSKDLVKSQTLSVRTFANMVTLNMMIQSGQSVPEELEEGVKHFSDIINKFAGSKDPSINWRQERDVLINDFKKLVTNSKDVINDTDITYEDLNSGVAESISSNDYPEVITFGGKPTKAEEPPVEEEEVVEEEKVVEEEQVPEPTPVKEASPEPVVAPAEESPVE